jgi:hypothetical protein
MFEAPVDKQESKGSTGRIGVAILVLLVIAGVIYYLSSKQSPKEAAPAAAAPSAPADPVHDLKIVRVTMNKDPMGTTAVWLVTLQNNPRPTPTPISVMKPITSARTTSRSS